MGAAGLLLLGAVANAQPAEFLRLRVMSFNVRWDGLDTGRNAWSNRCSVAIDVIRRADVDVIGLQEPSREQTRDLEQGLTTHVAYTGPHERDQHVPILFRPDRFKLEAGGSFWLVASSELEGGTRRCTWVHLRDRDGQGVQVFNVHLDHRSAASRQASVRVLLREVRERRLTDPFVITGDFNEGPEGAAVQFLTANGWRDALATGRPGMKEEGTGHGFTGHATGKRIDFILASEHDTVVETGILHDHRERDGLFPSDQFPVIATLELATRRPARAVREVRLPRERNGFAGREAFPN